MPLQFAKHEPNLVAYDVLMLEASEGKIQPGQLTQIALTSDDNSMVMEVSELVSDTPEPAYLINPNIFIVIP